LKHFRLNIAYLLEAITMAGVKKYPMLNESFEFNSQLFEHWYKNMNSDVNRIKVLDSLRTWRRKMVDLYYFKNGDSDS
jgi:L-rhamnose mutarotase